jgi:hypothetical protein
MAKLFNTPGGRLARATRANSRVVPWSVVAFGPALAERLGDNYASGRPRDRIAAEFVARCILTGQRRLPRRIHERDMRRWWRRKQDSGQPLLDSSSPAGIRFDRLAPIEAGYLCAMLCEAGRVMTDNAKHSPVGSRAARGAA